MFASLQLMHLCQKDYSLKAKFSIIFTKKVNRDILVEWYTEYRVILNGRNVLI